MHAEASEAFSPSEIDRALRSLARRKAALDVEEARWLRLGEEQNVWSKLGYVHALEYLERVFGYGPRVAVERLRVANELGSLPELEAGLETGELNYSVVRELTRVATPKTVRRWLAAARGKNLRDVERMVSGHRKGDDPDDAPDPKLVKLGVWLELDAESFALYRQVRAMLDDEADAKLSDAEFIASVARSLVANGARGTSGDSAGTMSRAQAAKPATMVHVTTCLGCDRGWQDGAGVRVELDAAALATAKCDAIIVDDGSGRRARSRISPTMRRKVLERDQHCCQARGCGSTRNVAVHEIADDAHGGVKNPANLTTLCGGHHKHSHQGALVITGRAPGSLRFENKTAPATGVDGAGNVDPNLAVAERVAKPKSKGPLSTKIPAAVYRLVMERAQHRCQVPGCRSARNLDVHHRKHRADGGDHHPDNLIVLCSGHHRLYHDGLLRITGAADARHFERSTDGTSTTFDVTLPAQQLPQTVGAPSPETHRRPTGPAVEDLADAQTALRQMGYKPAIAKRAVERARAHVGADSDLVAIIKEALKHCS